MHYNMLDKKIKYVLKKLKKFLMINSNPKNIYS